MFAKPPNWSPCCCPGPLGPPVYLQQGSQRNPAKPKAGPAAATILQSPPLHSEEDTGSPCLSWDHEAHHSHFSGLVPHKPLPPPAVVTPAPLGFSSDTPALPPNQGLCTSSPLCLDDSIPATQEACSLTCCKSCSNVTCSVRAYLVTLSSMTLSPRHLPPKDLSRFPALC